MIFFHAETVRKLHSWQLTRIQKNNGCEKCKSEFIKLFSIV